MGVGCLVIACSALHRAPAPSLWGKSDVDNIGVCVRAGGEAVILFPLPSHGIAYSQSHHSEESGQGDRGWCQ